MSLRQRLIQSGAAGAVLLAALFLAPTEGLRTVPYTDIGGVKTWCYGQTVGHAKARYTEQECADDLAKTTRQYHAGVMQIVPPEAPQSVQAALTSVAYNVGVAGIRHPTLLVPLSRHDWEGVCAAIEAPWVGKRGVAKGFKATVKGRPVRGLENRRAAEADLCRQDL